MNKIVYKGRWIRNWFSNMFDIRKNIEGTFIDNMMEMSEPIYFKTTNETIPVYTVEHYYQAWKAINEEDAIRIAKTTSPYEAKRLANTLPRRLEWQTIKVAVMAEALQHKFSKGSYWGNKLVESKGKIVEWNNWHDNYWGNCICPKCKYIKGQNVLGRLLVNIRKKLNKNKRRK